MIDGQPLKVSCGLGVNSVAKLVGMHALGIVPDAILFADTGSEMPGTYEYIPILQGWLAGAGFPALVVVKNASPRAGDASLYDECWRKAMLPSISYGFHRHSCALKWKAAPQDRWCRSWPLARAAWEAGRKVIVAVGFDAGGGDCKRYFKATAREATDPCGRYAYWYPLRDWGWDRDLCVQAIREAGLPVPPKSSCFMCAARTKPEIADMVGSAPVQLLKALALEARAMPKLDKIKGLGCRFSWNSYLTQFATGVANPKGQ